MTVKNTIDAVYYDSVARVCAEELAELERKEKELNIEPDHQIDTFTKVAALPGKRHSIVTDLTMKLLGLDVSRSLYALPDLLQSNALLPVLTIALSALACQHALLHWPHVCDHVCVCCACCAAHLVTGAEHSVRIIISHATLGCRPSQSLGAAGLHKAYRLCEHLLPSVHALLAGLPRLVLDRLLLALLRAVVMILHALPAVLLSAATVLTTHIRHCLHACC